LFPVSPLVHPFAVPQPLNAYPALAIVFTVGNALAVLYSNMPLV
jgi:hypothetical protein